MKKILLIISILSFTVSNSQDLNTFDFGIIVGVNYGSTDDLTISGGIAGINESFNSSKKTGYQAGLYFQINFNDMYVRPEVLYSISKSSYNSKDFNQTKINIPLLYGFTVIKPISIFLGPSFQYTLTSDLKDVVFEKIDIKNELAVNGQIGVAIQLGKQIRLDARYEKGISKNIVSLQDTASDGFNYDINAKPSQFIFNISLQL